MEKSYLKYVLSLAVMGIVIYGFMWRSHESGIIYIDNMKLFNAFELKKKLESEIKSDRQKRKFTMDSLKLEYNAFVHQVDSLATVGKPVGGLEIKSRQFQRYMDEKEKDLERKDLARTNQADQQIWQQLNQYVEEYGRENGYDVVFGVSGNGNIMYGKKELDKTEEVIRYVNKKYLGKK